MVELPYSPEFVETQLSKHGVLESNSYHIIHSDAQSIKDDLSGWFKRKKSKSSSRGKKKRLIQLGKKKEFYELQKLGQGGMGSVFLIQDRKNLTKYALKVHDRPTPWEYHILNQLHKRRTQEQQQGSQLHVLPVYDFYLYNDTSFLLMAPVSHGLTLLDVLNLYIKQ